MDNKTILGKIQSIVQDILDNESLNINEQTEATDVEGWDSLAHINIVSQVESEFGVRFSLDELARFSTVGKIIEAVQHPNADKLRVCKVDAGPHSAQGPLQIVCGAPNARAGIRVPLALVGAELPPGEDGKPFKIGVGKLRGVESLELRRLRGPLDLLACAKLPLRGRGSEYGADARASSMCSIGV